LTVFWRDLLGTALLTTFSLKYVAPVWIVLSVAERFGPIHGERPSISAQLKGVLFQVVGVAVGSIPVFLLWRWVPHPPTLAILALPLALLTSDFLQYWEHRFEHLWLLWRFHAVHHSTRELCANSNFTHFSHSFLMAVFYGVPMSLLTPDPLSIAPVLAVVLGWNAYLHSPIRLSVGPLRWLLADNRFHRIHHSTDRRHFDRNFGTFLSIWDVAFGTAYWANPDEWPKTGLPDRGEIDSVGDVLLRPFLPWRRSPQLELP
jgi:sterol desaturase/sphingolipid hydroxylase (fatty acid hydroxylase superfamily)